MIPLISDNLEAIRDLCRSHEVVSLDLYGSAAGDTFDPDLSNINFVVDMGEPVPGTAFRYLDLIADLEDLLATEVHMVTEASLGDNLLREIIDSQRVRLYEIDHDQAPA
jgi:predicted nucleotidyltransferase